MATTTNYSWETPDDTDLVKDGAAAIRTLGSSIDTTTKALNPSTTLGDIEYRSSTANTNTRLGIGTTGQVLAVSGGVPAWSTLAASSMAFTQIATAAVTSGSTVTISGLSGYNTLYISYEGISTNSTSNPTVAIRFNGDTGNNYNYYGFYLSTVGSANQVANTSKLDVGVQGNNAGNSMSGAMMVYGANSTGVKVGHYTNGSSNTAGGASMNICGYTYVGTSVISSVSITCDIGAFDQGTLRVIGSTN